MKPPPRTFQCACFIWAWRSIAAARCRFRRSRDCARIFPESAYPARTSRGPNASARALSDEAPCAIRTIGSPRIATARSLFLTNKDDRHGSLQGRPRHARQGLKSREEPPKEGPPRRASDTGGTDEVCRASTGETCYQCTLAEVRHREQPRKILRLGPLAGLVATHVGSRQHQRGLEIVAK